MLRWKGREWVISVLKALAGLPKQMQFQFRLELNEYGQDMLSVNQMYDPECVQKFI